LIMSNCGPQTIVPYVVNLTSSSLSIFGCAFILVLYSRIRNRDTISKLILFLTIADLFYSLSIAISQIFLFFNYYSYVMCVTFRCFIQFFIVSSFCWTSCIAVQLFLEVRYLSRFEHTNRFFYGYHMISWTLPLLLVLISLFSNSIEESEQGWCHAKRDYELLFWFSPMIITLIWNMIFYAMISRQIWVVFSAVKKVGEQGLKTELKVALKLSTLLLVIVVCWMFDVWNHSSKYFLNICPNEILYVLQDMMTPFQGFLNSIVYGLSTKELKSSFFTMVSCCHKKAQRFLKEEEEEQLLP